MMVGENEEMQDEGPVEQPLNAPEWADAADEEEEVVEPLAYIDDDPNLAVKFSESDEGKEALKEISEQVRKDFKSARDSSAEYREMNAKVMAFFMCKVEKRAPPFEDSANVNVPVTLENIQRISLRMEKEIFGNWRHVYSFVPNADTPEAKEMSDILSVHGNWQIRENIPSFRQEASRGIQQFCLSGDWIVHSYYDPYTRQNCHQTVTPDEFFCPYTYVSVAPDMSDLPYYGRILYWQRHELQQRSEEWHDVEELLDGSPPSWTDGDADGADMPMHDTVGDTQGVSKEDDGEKNRSPYQLIWYEGWLELPNQTQDRWCQVVVDRDRGHVLMLRINEDEDWRDAIRHKNQRREAEMYDQSIQEYGMAMEQYATQQIATAGMPVDPMMMMPEPEAPIMPDWMDGGEDPDTGEKFVNREPDPVLRRPVYMWARATAVQAMAGFHGLGYGRVQGDFNRAINMLLSQYIDAGTMANAPGYMAGAEVKFDEDLKFGPGQINYANVSGEKLASLLMPIPVKEPSPSIMGAIRDVQTWSKGSIGADDILSGKSGKSGETYRGQSERLEQAQSQNSVIATHFAWGLKQVLENNARLNAMFLPEREVLDLMDFRAGTVKRVEMSRDLYRQGYKVEISSDLRFIPEQVRAQEAAEMMQLPQLQPALQGNLAFLYETTKNYLIAKGQYDLIPLLGPPPPMPQTPFGIMPQAPQEGDVNDKKGTAGGVPAQGGEGP